MSSANLAPRELYRYKWRSQLWLTKYENRLPFVTTDGGSVLLKYEESVATAIKHHLSDRVSLILHDDSGKKWSLSNLAKTPEFGGGGGCGGGIKLTALAESAAAAYAWSRWNECEITDGYDQSIIGECPHVILGELSPAWKASSILGAEVLYNEFGRIQYQFHRGSAWVNALESVFKKLNAKEQVFSNLNKWSPADIYLISDIGARIDFSCIENITDLNKVLLDAFKTRDILGVSLKLLKSSAKISYHNIGETHPIIKFGGVSLGQSGFFCSKDVIVYFGDSEKIQFRTFPETFQGEIKGKNASHGKIGFGPLSRILMDCQAPIILTPQTLKNQINENNPILFHKMFEVYCEHSNEKNQLTLDNFIATCKSKGGAWMYSKFFGLHLVNSILRSASADEFVSRCICYASSCGLMSAPFVKLQ